LVAGSSPILSRDILQYSRIGRKLAASDSCYGYQRRNSISVLSNLKIVEG
jgi:hypothetical protein